MKAFFDQVTYQEIIDFFNGKVPPLDTVIVSGRTSLWPSFADHLRKSLGAVSNWVSFNHNPTELKQAVVLGAMERHFRWRHLIVEEPGIIGDFTVLYEHSGPNDWRYHDFERSEESHQFYLGNSALVKIGIRTSNGFHQCFAFNPSDYYNNDKTLEIKLIFDRNGRLQAEVQNSRGRVQRFRVHTDVAILSYNDRPWPLGASKLLELDPKELMVR